MKIALLLTGQLRTFDMVKYLHFHTIMAHYDTDVFLSIDLDNSLQCLNKNKKSKSTIIDAKNAIDFFKPKGHFILENFNDEFNKIKQNNTHVQQNVKLLFEQYYIVKNAYRLMLEHMKKTNTTYDVVLRLRFDQFIWSNETLSILRNINKKTNKIIYDKQNIEKLKLLSHGKKLVFNPMLNNSIYLFGFGRFKQYNYSYATDQFWFHKSDLITTIYNFYDSLPLLLHHAIKENKGENGALIEHLWHRYLTKNKINMNKSNIKGIFVREFN